MRSGLLGDVRQFVGEQASSLGAAGCVLAGREHKVVADGVRPRADRPCGVGRVVVGVDTDAAAAAATARPAA
jgi:hypothetical protein